MVHPGLGPYVFQNDPDNLAPFSFSQVSGIAVPVGCAEQYGRRPGFAQEVDHVSLQHWGAWDDVGGQDRHPAGGDELDVQAHAAQEMIPIRRLGVGVLVLALNQRFVGEGRFPVEIQPHGVGLVATRRVVAVNEG